MPRGSLTDNHNTLSSINNYIIYYIITTLSVAFIFTCLSFISVYGNRWARATECKTLFICTTDYTIENA